MDGVKSINEGVNLDPIQRLRASRDGTYHDGKQSDCAVFVRVIFL